MITLKTLNFTPIDHHGILMSYSIYESQAARGTRGERIPRNVHDASVSAENETRRRWLALGSGFEYDNTRNRGLVRRIKWIDERFVAMRNDIRSKKGRVKTLQSFKDYLSQVFFPFNLVQFSSGAPRRTQRLNRYHQLRGDGLDVNMNPNILKLPDFSELVSSSEQSSSWLFPDRETLDAGLKSEADVEGDNDRDVSGFGCEPSLKNGEPSSENTKPPLSFNKSTQTNLCPCPPLTLP